MNFVFISPQFPKSYWNFCDRLKKNGVNVLGIGDTPYDALSPELRGSLTEYYKVNSLENYDEKVRAMGYFIFKYGKIDWLESNNEYWLESDAALRTDFNITTGMQNAHIRDFKAKSAMKAFYEKAGVPTARYYVIENDGGAYDFAHRVGYPVIVKPDIGVGASATYRLNSDEELAFFLRHRDGTIYIMEEFVNGTIESYDGIVDLDNEVVFETSHLFPEPIMNIVNDSDDLAYYSQKDIPADLLDAGRRTLKAFDVRGRCFHFEFFRLNEDKEGLGKKGEIVGLEVNMRTPGGYTPDMMNYANDCDIYQMYADMVTYGKNHQPPFERKYTCVYASRRDGHHYTHTHEEIMARYGTNMVMQERMPEILADAMGNTFYTARFTDPGEVQPFIEFVQG